MSWEKAKNAAWREFGRRYWRTLLALDVARRSMPVVLISTLVGLVGGGVWWLAARRPSVDLPAPTGALWWLWLLLGIGVLFSAAWAAYRWWNPTGVRTGRRVAALAAATVVAVVALTLWGRD